MKNPIAASRRALAGASAFISAVTLPIAARAATAGGGNLPWDTPLTTLKTDLTGPVAFTISLLAMAACGIGLVFGGEINEFIRRVLILIMVCAFLVSVTNLATALGLAGALV